MEQVLEEKIHYPYILFKLDKVLYSIDSRYVSTIMMLPKYESVPQAPEYVTGVFMHRDEAVQMFDLRRAFGLSSLEEESRQFSQMLEERKQDHIRWVRELERSTLAGEPFTLATDPHKCAFGRWYDSYQPDSQVVGFHLKKIEEPHRKLHESALEIARCAEAPDSDQQGACVKEKLERAEREYVSQVIGLLDEAKDLFNTTVFREMVLVLGGGTGLGIVVDEVLSVEDLEAVDDRGNLNRKDKSTMIRGIRKSGKRDDIILEVDIPAILEVMDRKAW